MLVLFETPAGYAVFKVGFKLIPIYAVHISCAY